MNKRVIIPLPSYGFDPTEASIPWKILSEKNVEISFATPDGKKAAADNRMLTGLGLGIWKGLLRAGADARAAYAEMLESPAFNNPMQYSDIKESDFDALLLPGGHDKSIREYLESAILQRLVIDFFKVSKPVAAICHGVVLVARSICSDTQTSVIYDYKTTALLQSQEKTAYNLTRLWLGDYYLTYPETTVEKEVKSALQTPSNFLRGNSGMFRDNPKKMGRGFVVHDRNFLSARWPGDVYNFSAELLKMLEGV